MGCLGANAAHHSYLGLCMGVHESLTEFYGAVYVLGIAVRNRRSYTAARCMACKSRQATPQHVETFNCSRAPADHDCVYVCDVRHAVCRCRKVVCTALFNAALEQSVCRENFR